MIIVTSFQNLDFVNELLRLHVTTVRKTSFVSYVKVLILKIVPKSQTILYQEKIKNLNIILGKEPTENGNTASSAQPGDIPDVATCIRATPYSPPPWKHGGSGFDKRCYHVCGSGDEDSDTSDTNS